MNLVLQPQHLPLYLNEDGVVLISGTRIPLDMIVFEFKQGATAEEIVSQFSTLDLADVYVVISYYLKNQPEVEAYLERRQQEAEEIRQKIEARFPSAGLRERLLARRSARSQELE